MKKILIALVLILTLSLGMAHAELGRVVSWRIGNDENGTPVYFVSYEMETGASHEFPASYDEFYSAVEIVAARRNEEAKKEERAKKRRNRTWLQNAWHDLSFWNKDD